MAKTNRSESKTRKGIDDYMQSRRVISITNIILSIAVLILALSTFSIRTETIAIPPHMTDEMRVAGNKGNEVYSLGWATFIASQAGNINEHSASFVLDMIIDYLSPNLRMQVEDSLRREVQLLVARGAEQNFKIENAIYDPRLNVAFVWGRREIRMPDVEPRQSRWTYEIRIEPNGRDPRVTYLNAYEGTPRRHNRPDLQDVNPFLTSEHEIRMATMDVEAPVKGKQIPINAAPAVTVDLSEVEDNEDANNE